MGKRKVKYIYNYYIIYILKVFLHLYTLGKRTDYLTTRLPLGLFSRASITRHTLLYVLHKFHFGDFYFKFYPKTLDIAFLALYLC